jgi:hypothetical protein
MLAEVPSYLRVCFTAIALLFATTLKYATRG